jgi:hypothetical protein
MPSIRIEDFELDESNESEIAYHGVTLDEIDEVLNGDYRLLPNAKRHRNQPYLMVGRTAAGRWLTIPIGPTEQLGVWRPATAFNSKQGEITRASRAPSQTLGSGDGQEDNGDGV